MGKKGKQRQRKYSLWNTARSELQKYIQAIIWGFICLLTHCSHILLHLGSIWFIATTEHLGNFPGLVEYYLHFSSVQSLSRVWLFATPWIQARQASISITNSRSLPKFMSIESVMPSSHLRELPGDDGAVVVLIQT